MSILTQRISRGICNIIIDRSFKRNALNLSLVKQLQATLIEFDNNTNYSIAILSGAGGNFCAGYDLNEVVDRRTGLPNINQISQMLWPIGTTLSTKKIVIAALDGHTTGFGYELALRCDFRVGENDARLGFLNRRFGIPIMNGGTVILPRLVGQAHALELVSTGKAQLAQEAQSIGVLNYIADIGCSMGRAVNLARMLAKFRQDALINDINKIRCEFQDSVEHLLIAERERSLAYLESCGPLELAVKFLDGSVGRHGATNLGNLQDPNPDVNL